MRNKKSRGLFDDQFRLDKISKLKDPLEKLNRYIKWEDFRSIIDQAFRETEPSLGSRPPFDRVMMFKFKNLGKKKHKVTLENEHRRMQQHCYR